MRKSILGNLFLLLIIGALATSCGSDNSTVGTESSSSAGTVDPNPPSTDDEYTGSNSCLQNLSDYIVGVELPGDINAIEVTTQDLNRKYKNSVIYADKYEKAVKKVVSRDSNKRRLLDYVNRAENCIEHGNNLIEIKVGSTYYLFNSSSDFPVEANPYKTIVYNGTKYRDFKLTEYKWHREYHGEF